MNKLKKKVFYTIFGILSLSLLSFIVIFNVQNYIEQKKVIERNLNMGSNHNMPPINNDKKVIDRNIRFMDTIIYTILLDSSDNVLEVINHSSNTIDNEIFQKS